MASSIQPQPHKQSCDGGFDAKLDALRRAITQGEQSGPAELFDVDAIIKEAKGCT